MSGAAAGVRPQPRAGSSSEFRTPAVAPGAARAKVVRPAAVAFASSSAPACPLAQPVFLRDSAHSPTLAIGAPTRAQLQSRLSSYPSSSRHPPPIARHELWVFEPQVGAT